MSRHPEVKWAQRPDKVYLTVQLPDAKDVKVDLDSEGIFTFSATAGAENNTYELKLELFDKVNKEESKINTGVRSIFCVIEKAEKGWWKKLLRGNGKAPHNVKVDWDKWVDEDDDGADNVDLGGMDFSNFGGDGMGMGPMGMGMGPMGMGMGMDDDFEDSDDEEQAEKTENGPKSGDVGKIEEATSEAKMETAAST